MKMLEAYLDIETTGLYPVGDSITVIGLCLSDSDQGKVVQLVDKGICRDALLEALQGVQMIYTYNGTRFDLPFITLSLRLDLSRHCEHRDLMFDCWKKGLYGGLKAVEAAFGIARELKGINGTDAVELWRKYNRDGDSESLVILLKYNQEDVLNLKLLKEKLYPQAF